MVKLFRSLGNRFETAIKRDSKTAAGHGPRASVCDSGGLISSLVLSQNRVAIEVVVEMHQRLVGVAEDDGHLRRSPEPVYLFGAV